MIIAHLLPHSARFPLIKHNGRYSWALSLAQRQSTLGHDVTIFAAPDSHDQSIIAWRSVQPNGTKLQNNTTLIRAAFADKSFDIYHSHFDYLPHTLLSSTPKPLLTTQHWFPNEIIATGLRNNQRTNAQAVPVTQLMRKTDASFHIPHSKVIYHGVDLAKFRPSGKAPTERYLFIGRITDSKGVKEAVDIALRNNVALDIVGKINASDKHYWDSFASKVDGNQIAYLGPKNQSEVIELLQNAKAVLFPSKTPEAFGLVTIEAQACGTPVIISDIGASNELVLDGRTGYVISTDVQYDLAIKRVSTISREECREHAKKFDINLMTENYISLYETIRSMR